MLHDHVCIVDDVSGENTSTRNANHGLCEAVS